MKQLQPIQAFKRISTWRFGAIFCLALLRTFTNPSILRAADDNSFGLATQGAFTGWFRSAEVELRIDSKETQRQGISVVNTNKSLAFEVTNRAIPAANSRQMWENGHGYCGEVSLQIVGLQMGFWAGQNQVRKLAGGEALLDDNYEKLLNSLHLQHVNWTGGKSKNDRKKFLQWIKEGLVAGKPVIFAVKTHEGWGTDEDYDHIMTADAVAHSISGQEYTDAAILYYSDGFDGIETNLTFGQLFGGYANIDQQYFLPSQAKIKLLNGKYVNCVGKQYGVRITAQDGDAECLPICLKSVVPRFEPNVTRGEKPATMNATVTMTNLLAGSNYTLLRWDVNAGSILDVPWTNIGKVFTPTNLEWQFTATNSFATRNVSFVSDSITFFRLVGNNEGTNSVK